MAYADYEFYTTKYYGSSIPDSQSFDKQAERASDFLDIVTRDRLVDGLPDLSLIHIWQNMMNYMDF